MTRAAKTARAAAGNRGGFFLPAVVGIDTGGTFTDLVAIVGGRLRTHKVASTPEDPAAAVLRGLHELLPDVRLGTLTYGSTVATNSLLERRGARVVLLTTAGFEDLIEIGRQDRPALYDLEPRPPEPLVHRKDRIGVVERIAFDGAILRSLKARSLRRVMQTVGRLNPEAVAVCFLHSYANPKHERRVGRALHAAGVAFVSLSHALVREYREYERLSTAVMNAYVGPVMSRHLQQLQRRLPGVRLRVMQSNGGAISARFASREPVRTVLSGPAAGILGAYQVANALRLQRVITFDMGGTSTDVSLLDGAPHLRSEWTIGGLPLKVPAVDIHTVGAGGGSIATLDTAGGMAVGPLSAGADPGPACYGKGRRPTVTDANLLLGRLLPGAFLGGRMSLDPCRARAAVEELGHGLGLDVHATAEGIVRVVNASMERAIRTISIERGHDPREYTLIGFGGAAGQHACELAAALGMPRVVIPQNPGLLSAWGALSADVQRDYVRTVRLTDAPVRRLQGLFRPLEHAAQSELRRERVPTAARHLSRSLDLRYQGQSYEITLPFAPRVLEAFHDAHQRLYGYADRNRPVEVVNLRVSATGREAHVLPGEFDTERSTRPITHRIRWNGRWRRAAAYERVGLRRGVAVTGPAVISELSGTTFLPPRWRATVHGSGHLVLTHAD